jgi:hypothetical protein
MENLKKYFEIRIDFNKIWNYVLWETDDDYFLVYDGDDGIARVCLRSKYEGFDYVSVNRHFRIPVGEKRLVKVKDRIFIIVERKCIVEYFKEEGWFVLVNTLPGVSLIEGDSIESKFDVYVEDDEMYCSDGKVVYVLDLRSNLWKKV